MNKKDYILIETTKPELVEKMIFEYFEDEHISHNGINIELGKHKNKNEVIVSFSNNLDNELFIFFFTFLSVNEEFQNDNYKGWFSASDKISANTKHKGFGGRLENDSFNTRVILTSEMTEDYTLGYSDHNKKIKFHYSGKFTIEDSQGFQKENFNKDNYTHIKNIEIVKSTPKIDQNKGCGIMAMAAVMVLVITSIVYVA
jgi:hypothetical protein